LVGGHIISLEGWQNIRGYIIWEPSR
jgi:hypothetical protein